MSTTRYGADSLLSLQLRTLVISHSGGADGTINPDGFYRISIRHVVPEGVIIVGRWHCSVASRESHEHPVGSAWYTPEFTVIELPFPWGAELYRGSNVPAGLADLVQQAYAARDGWGIIAYARDDAYATPGRSRIMHCTRRPNSLGRFQRQTWEIPEDRLVESLAAVLDGSAPPDSIDRSSETTRDVYVCTHGAVDACCATFGFPLYAVLRKMADNTGSDVRIWRASHFGGHRFAPTFLELPSGRYWGRVDATDASALLHHRSAPAEVRHLYRGSALLDNGVEQVVEAEVFAQMGWALDVSEITALDIRQVRDGEWEATVDIASGSGGCTWTIGAVQTGVARLRGHCNYDFEIESPQFDTRVISRNPRS